ncbi:MAG: hypothetical protein HGA87_04880, partial [Desulfobulbaceae bacterium]|nr:hypothetical protein [Desulfobulbaceae bacterium]
MTSHVKKFRNARLASVVLAAFLVLPFVAAPVFAADNPKVQESMKDLKDQTAKLGEPKLEGENLFFGTTIINGDFAIVDAIKTKHAATATIFAKKGTNFVRVSTNVMKDGQRAIG